MIVMIAPSRMSGKTIISLEQTLDYMVERRFYWKAIRNKKKLKRRKNNYDRERI